MKSIQFTPRTASAIRKADALPTVLPGGKMRKGSPFFPSAGAGDYSGFFAVTENKETGNLAVAGGWIQVVNRWHEVEAEDDLVVAGNSVVTIEIDVDRVTGVITATVGAMSIIFATTTLLPYRGRLVLAMLDGSGPARVISQHQFGLGFVSVLGEVDE